MTSSEPRNPFYFLLLLASLLFVMTALGYALVPSLEQNARDMRGVVQQHSPFRETLNRDGWLWLLWELGAMIVLGVASMVLDRIRSLRKQRAEQMLARRASEG